MKRSVMSCVMLVILSVPLLAADLKITGETVVAPYRLVELSANGADADAALLWDVYPEELADIREVNGRLIFVAPPGVYKVKLRTVKGKVVDTARATVTITGTPIPPEPIPPNPTPTPDSRFGLVGVSKAAAASIATYPAKPTDQAKLAGAQRSLASAIAAGGVQPTAAAILTAWQRANNDAVPAATWGPWGTTVAAKLKELYSAKKLATKADWVDAFNEIAQGLE